VGENMMIMDYSTSVLAAFAVVLSAAVLITMFIIEYIPPRIMVETTFKTDIAITFTITLISWIASTCITDYLIFIL
jgi:hypothetical protein